jgi:formate hydrogenlyase subunit 4
MQGRRGPSPLQPYRELRRLWRKSRVAPADSSIVYRVAPPLVAACAVCAILVLPSGGGGPLGHDVLVLVGLLALARFAIALSSWDTGSGFAIMGAARDLTVAVSVELLLLLCLVLAALPAGSTDLNVMAAAASGTAIWFSPAHWCGLAGFALVAIAETGRQPIDNPDTHLELTMIHEGPLLEYAGPDLAYLQWAASARHWIVLVLAATLFLPHPGDPIGAVAVSAFWMGAACLGLAFVETMVAKVRLLRIPVLFGVGTAIALIGLVSRAFV